MGTKADKRAHRLAAALDREWWKAWADAWLWIGERLRYQTDSRYRAHVDAEHEKKLRARALVGSLLAMGGLR
jgi:hypothetical protein